MPNPDDNARRSHEPQTEIPIDALGALRGLAAALDDSTMRFGFGLKQRSGNVTADVALIVIVPRKRAAEDVPAALRVPRTFGGFRTDVVEDREIPLQGDSVCRALAFTPDSQPYDPLVGGAQISSHAQIRADGEIHTHEGTLGALMRRRADGRHVLLTCRHVLPDAGHPAFQPARSSPAATNIGTVLPAPSWPDCTLIEPNGSRGLSASIAEHLGTVRGTASVHHGQHVTFRGAVTGLSGGYVVYLVADVQTGAVSSFSFVAVPPGIVAWCGDSGAVVLDDHRRIVGLLASMGTWVTDDQGVPVSNIANAFAIGPVQDALAADIAVQPQVDSVTPSNAAATLSTLGRVTITGCGFDSSSQVFFDQTPATLPTAHSPQSVQVIPPFLALGTSVHVRVSNQWGEWSAPTAGSVFNY